MSSSNNVDLVISSIYGNGRIGVHKRLGDSYVYELTDHLGNVRAVFSKNEMYTIRKGIGITEEKGSEKE